MGLKRAAGHRYYVHGMDMAHRVINMAATARLVVQMTPQEKRTLDSRAKRVGLATAEFVRRRLNASDDIGDHREEIEAMLTALEITAPQVLRAVDTAMASIEAISAKLDSMKSETPS